jgi:hypothetical protein
MDMQRNFTAFEGASSGPYDQGLLMQKLRLQLAPSWIATNLRQLTIRSQRKEENLLAEPEQAGELFSPEVMGGLSNPATPQRARDIFTRAT